MAFPFHRLPKKTSIHENLLVSAFEEKVFNMIQKFILSCLGFVMMIGCDSSLRTPAADRSVYPAADNQIGVFKIYTSSEYKHDLDELVERLITLHPQPFEFTTETEFFSHVADLKSQIGDETTLGEFFWMLSEVISMIGCSHTTLSYFNQEDKLLPDRLRFPVEARFIGERLYIIDALTNATLLSPGDEIVSINDEPVLDVRDSIYRHIPTDGHITGWKEGLTNAYFTAYIAYHSGFAETYSVQTTSHDESIRLRQLETHQYKPIIPPGDAYPDRLCLSILTNQNAAVIKVRNSEFYGNDAYTFQKFVDESFQAIEDSGVDHLIVDYRGNRGGSGGANAYLLQHFADTPFAWFAKNSDGAEPLKAPLAPAANAFKGETFVLVDGVTLSSTGHFMSLVKAHSFATIIGSESGATYTVNANTQRFSSTNLGITYSIAQSTFLTPVKGYPKDQGILPDFEVIPDIKAILNNQDPVLDFTLRLIAGEQ